MPKTLQTVGLSLLRFFIAIIFIYHGYQKVAEPAVAMETFGKLGLYEFLAPVVGWLEVLCGLFLLVGKWHQINAAILTFIILGAMATVQIPLAIAKETLLSCGLERDLVMFAGLLLLLGYGPGAFAMDREG